MVSNSFSENLYHVYHIFSDIFPCLSYISQLKPSSGPYHPPWFVYQSERQDISGSFASVLCTKNSSSESLSVLITTRATAQGTTGRLEPYVALESATVRSYSSARTIGRSYADLFPLMVLPPGTTILGLGSKEVLSWVVILKVGGVGCFPGETRLEWLMFT